MLWLKKTVTIVIPAVLFFAPAFAQDSSNIDKWLSFPDKVFASLNKKAAYAVEALDKKTDRYLSKLSKQEARLKRRLAKRDSLQAEQLFGA